MKLPVYPISQLSQTILEQFLLWRYFMGVWKKCENHPKVTRTTWKMWDIFVQALFFLFCTLDIFRLHFVMIHMFQSFLLPSVLPQLSQTIPQNFFIWRYFITMLKMRNSPENNQNYLKNARFFSCRHCFSFLALSIYFDFIFVMIRMFQSFLLPSGLASSAYWGN